MDVKHFTSLNLTIVTANEDTKGENWFKSVLSSL